MSNSLRVLGSSITWRPAAINQRVMDVVRRDLPTCVIVTNDLGELALCRNTRGGLRYAFSAPDEGEFTRLLSVFISGHWLGAARKEDNHV